MNENTGVDAQFLGIMFVLGINVAVDSRPDRRNNTPLIITNTCGLVVNLLWVALAYWTVLHEHCRAAGVLLASLLPCLGMPTVDIVLCTLLDLHGADALLMCSWIFGLHSEEGSLAVLPPRHQTLHVHVSVPLWPIS